jgi:tetratricopeptide (TPR) repeat protein
MPSHTFTRVGHWQDSIDANIASAKAAVSEECAAEELHAMDYQTYAYLQTGQDAAAKRVVERLPSVVERLQPLAVCGATPGFAGVFAAAMIPARYTLERRAWAEAARLEVRSSKAAYPESLTRFARALGLARTGQVAAAREELSQLEALHQKLLAGKDMYWSGQVDIQRKIAAAWVVLAEGRPAEALALLRKAADAEDATEQSAITPGPLAPAHEMLGEMLLEAKRAQEALVAFEAILAKQPNRFRAVYGSARAAEAGGDRNKAAEYFRKLIDISARADAPRTELEQAKRFGR